MREDLRRRAGRGLLAGAHPAGHNGQPLAEHQDRLAVARGVRLPEVHPRGCLSLNLQHTVKDVV